MSVADDTKWLIRAMALLADTLEAWEGEENSVKEEHADHIADLNAFFDEYLKMKARIE